MLKKNSNTWLHQWIEIWYCEYDGSTIHLWFVFWVWSLFWYLSLRLTLASAGGQTHGGLSQMLGHQTPGCSLQAGTETAPCRDQEHPQNRGNVAKPLPRPWPAHLRTEKHDLISSQSGLRSPKMRWCSRLCLSSETMTKIRSHFRWFLIFFLYFLAHIPHNLIETTYGCIFPGLTMQFSGLERSRVLSMVERSYLTFSYILNDTTTIWYTPDLASLLLHWCVGPNLTRWGVE